MAPASPTAMAAARSETTWLALASVLVASAWTLFAGKDVGWDLFNHHLYLPFSLLSGRFQIDLFGAGPQSYQNPVGYLPFYALVRSGLPAWVIGQILSAVVVAASTWGLWRVACLVFGTHERERMPRLLAVAMGLGAPVFALLIGTSSTDPLCTALLIVALAIALDPSARTGSAAAGGLAMGLAMAIKPTMVIFALPALVMATARAAAGQWSWITWAANAGACLVALGVAAGPWAWWLWSEFGNPVFPLFNQVFHSPFAPEGVVVALRFLPNSPEDWVLRLWEMAKFKPFTTVEAFVPDIRPLAAAVATIAAAIAVTLRRGAGVWSQRSTWARADVQLGLLLAVIYPLWMASSGNARYAMPWFLLIGILLVRAGQVWIRNAWAFTGLIGLLSLQLVGYVSAGDHRLLLTQPWDSREYLPAEVPPRLKNEPFLHLSVGVQTYAVVAPLLHPAGAMVNVVGQMSLPRQGPLADQLAQRLQAWRGRTRFLFSPPVKPGSPKLARAIAAENWAQTYRLGLKIDPTDCEVIKLLTPPPGQARPAGDWSETHYVLSCAAVEERRDDPALDARLRQADRVFALLESQCPRPFAPRPMASDFGPQVTWRRYLNSDAKIEISDAEGVVLSHFRSANPVFLGSVDHVISNGGKDACPAWKQLSKH